jgi:predicted GNAT family acetyltransferase
MKEYGMTVTFQDKRNRNIDITIDDEYPPKVVAHHDGQEIGHLEFTDYDESYILLSHAELNEKYHKAGIGSEMMKEIVELVNGELLVPRFEWNKPAGHEIYYSEEGANFICSCLRNGIINKSNIAHDISSIYDQILDN